MKKNMLTLTLLLVIVLLLVGCVEQVSEEITDKKITVSGTIADIEYNDDTCIIVLQGENHTLQTYNFYSRDVITFDLQVGMNVIMHCSHMKFGKAYNIDTVLFQ